MRSQDPVRWDVMVVFSFGAVEMHLCMRVDISDDKAEHLGSYGKFAHVTLTLKLTKQFIAVKVAQ